MKWFWLTLFWSFTVFAVIAGVLAFTGLMPVVGGSRDVLVACWALAVVSLSGVALTLWAWEREAS